MKWGKSQKIEAYSHIINGINPHLLAYPTGRLVPAFDVQIAQLLTHGGAMTELDQLSPKRVMAMSRDNQTEFK